MRIGLRIIMRYIWGIIILFTISCSVIEPDTQKPEVSIDMPLNNMVVGNRVIIKASASDNEGIHMVKFYFDSKHDSTGDDYHPPYEDTLVFQSGQFKLASQHRIFAIAVDKAENQMISNFVNVYYLWTLLSEDGNESFKRNISKVFVRNTESTLEFRVEINGEWKDPHQKLSGINCGIFLDADENTATGMPQDTIQTLFNSFLTLSDSLKYSVGDIGPDYLIIIGVEGNGLWKWDQTSNNWIMYGSLKNVHMENDTNYFEVAVDYSILGNPENIDISIANITYTPDTCFWDLVPNVGHLTYIKDSGLYVGE